MESAEHRAAGFASAATPVIQTPKSLAATVGRPGSEHIRFAQDLRVSIPVEISTAAHSSSSAYLMTLALLVDPKPGSAGKQLDFLEQQLGPERRQLIHGYHESIAVMGEQFRLPLLEIAFPALKRMPAKRLEFLLDLARRLMEMDGKIDFYEFCVYRILSRNLLQAAAPSARRNKGRSPSRAAVRSAAVQVLSLLADRGHDSPEDKKQAFRAGLSVFGEWSGKTAFEPISAGAVVAFDNSLNVLQRMNNAATQSLLEAINTTVAHDGKVSIREAEMIRAICASLDCPLPPLIPEASS